MIFALIPPIVSTEFLLNCTARANGITDQMLKRFWIPVTMNSKQNTCVPMRIRRRKKMAKSNKIRVEENENDKRIQLQILYNLLKHVEDEDGSGYNAWAMGQAQKRLKKIRRLAKIYVQKSGGIV
jgi:hypothetical protein